MTALIVTPPTRRYKQPGLRKSVFLAGSIEMGVAEDWQHQTATKLAPLAGVVYNPRRAEWDSSWAQTIDNPDFNAQVTWELDMIQEADIVIFYFDPNTKSPVTLLELGYACGTKPAQTYVACPAGFYRRGNVEITCERFGVRFFESLDKLLPSVNSVLTNINR